MNTLPADHLHRSGMPQPPGFRPDPPGGIPRRSRSAVARVMRVVAAVLVAATAAIGLLHTPWARPLLARIGGCPAMRLTAAQANGARLKGIGSLRGGVSAPQRPALGFALNRTTPSEVRAWAARTGVECTSKTLGLQSFHCRNVRRNALPGMAAATPPPGSEAGAIEDLALTFDPAGQLISVDALTRRVPPAQAVAAFSSSDAHLAALLGPPTDRHGDATVAALVRMPLAMSEARYRFRDYVAIVTVANLSSGLAEREQYLSGT